MPLAISPRPLRGFDTARLPGFRFGVLFSYGTADCLELFRRPRRLAGPTSGGGGDEASEDGEDQQAEDGGPSPEGGRGQQLRASRRSAKTRVPR